MVHSVESMVKGEQRERDTQRERTLRNNAITSLVTLRRCREEEKKKKRDGVRDE